MKCIVLAVLLCYVVALVFGAPEDRQIEVRYDDKQTSGAAIPTIRERQGTVKLDLTRKKDYDVQAYAGHRRVDVGPFSRSGNVAGLEFNWYPRGK